MYKTGIDPEMHRTNVRKIGKIGKIGTQLKFDLLDTIQVSGRLFWPTFGPTESSRDST